LAFKFIGHGFRIWAAEPSNRYAYGQPEQSTTNQQMTISNGTAVVPSVLASPETINSTNSQYKQFVDPGDQMSTLN